MKTATHIALILAAGVGLGLLVRTIRSSRQADGPRPDEVVYTNDGSDTEGEVYTGEPVQPPEGEEWLSRFELTERSGETVTSEDLLGQPYLVSFFFTTCPSICIQQNQKLQELQEMFEGQGVRFVAISCDPETDTPDKLREYAARFGADKDQWLFMTGDMTYIRRVGAEVYKLPVNRKFHTERFVLVDPEGKVVDYYTWPDPRQYEALQEKIRQMISKES